MFSKPARSVCRKAIFRHWKNDEIFKSITSSCSCSQLKFGKEEKTKPYLAMPIRTNYRKFIGAFHCSTSACQIVDSFLLIPLLTKAFDLFKFFATRRRSAYVLTYIPPHYKHNSVLCWIPLFLFPEVFHIARHGRQFF